jgi:hypothetical protein
VSSPSQQIGEGQPGATEPIVEPDTEVVQRHPRRQTRPQTLKLVGPFPPEAEGVEQLVVDRFHDLADGGDPPPQVFGPASLSGVALGRMDEARSVVFEPAPMVLDALETLVGYVGSRADRSRADEPFVRGGPHGEEGLRQSLVGGGGSPETEARHDPRGIDRREQGEAFVPSDAVGPTDVGVTGQPPRAPALAVPGGHRRAVERLVGALPRPQEGRQVQDDLLDESRTGAHEAVELGAGWQCGESVEQVGFGVAVEVSLASKPGPPGEDRQGYDLAFGEGGLGSGTLFRPTRLAEVVGDDVECGEEGVHVDHKSPVPFPSGLVGKPTLVRGHLPLKSSTGNSHQAFKGTLADPVKKQRFAHEFPMVAQGKYDVYGLFIERATQILKPGGRLGLITQDTFIDKQWARGLRKLLSTKTTLRYVIGLNPFGQLFFEAMNTPCITVADVTTEFQSNSGIALISTPPADFKGLTKDERRKRVVATVREAIEQIAIQHEPIIVGFARAAKIPLERLRETAKDRWDLSGLPTVAELPRNWNTAADLLEVRQGVTPGGVLDLFLMAEEEAKHLQLEEALVHKAIKSNVVERWRTAWIDRVLLYPYRVTNEAAVPAFTIELQRIADKGLRQTLRQLGVEDALDFDKQLDDRERRIVQRVGLNRLSAEDLLKHRVALGLVPYPQTARYLVEHYETLESRVFKNRNIRDFNRQWYEYLWPRDSAIMLGKNRIVSPTLVKHVRFAPDNVGYLSDHACLFLQPTAKTIATWRELHKQLAEAWGTSVRDEDALKYCLAFLNSNYAQERLVTGHMPTPKGYYAITEDYLREIPIPPPSDGKLTAEMVNLVDRLSAADSEEVTSRLESRLSALTNTVIRGS